MIAPNDTTVAPLGTYLFHREIHNLIEEYDAAELKKARNKKRGRPLKINPKFFR